MAPPGGGAGGRAFSTWEGGSGFGVGSDIAHSRRQGPKWPFSLEICLGLGRQAPAPNPDPPPWGVCTPEHKAPPWVGKKTPEPIPLGGVRQASQKFFSSPEKWAKKWIKPGSKRWAREFFFGKKYFHNWQLLLEFSQLQLFNSQFQLGNPMGRISQQLFSKQPKFSSLLAQPPPQRSLSDDLPRSQKIFLLRASHRGSKVCQILFGRFFSLQEKSMKT